MRQIARGGWIAAAVVLAVAVHADAADDLTPFLDYPGHVVNCGLKLISSTLTAGEVSQMFDRPFMGGMDRHGAIVSGSPDAIEAAALEAIESAPDRFILGADCTLPADINWDNIRKAIDTAHGYR